MELDGLDGRAPRAAAFILSDDEEEGTAGPGAAREPAGAATPGAAREAAQGDGGKTGEQPQQPQPQPIPLAPRRPQPWSADDVNPACLVPVATAWLLPPTYTATTADAAEAAAAAAAHRQQGAGAASTSGSGAHAWDLRRMSR